MLVILYKVFFAESLASCIPKLLTKPTKSASERLYMLHTLLVHVAIRTALRPKVLAIFETLIVKLYAALLVLLTAYALYRHILYTVTELCSHNCA